MHVKLPSIILLSYHVKSTIWKLTNQSTIPLKIQMSKEIWFEGFLPSVNPKMARYIRTCAKCIKLEGRRGFLGTCTTSTPIHKKGKKKKILHLDPSTLINQIIHVCSHLGIHHRKGKKQSHTHTKWWSKSLAGIKHKYGWVILNCLKLASSHLSTSKIGDACLMSHPITSQNKGVTFSCATFPVFLSWSFTKEGCLF